MWVRQTSIRPVAPFARIEAHTLDAVRSLLLSEDEEIQDVLDDAFERFDASQPALSQKLGEVLARPLGEAPLALGYFLCLAVWMSFEEAQGARLGQVSLEELEATSELVSLDEALRQGDPSEKLETDDVIAMEQPALVRFVHEHVEAILEVHGAAVELAELQLVYRMVLIEMLALSYAVRAPAGFPVTKAEALA